jgi:hypothetical protein
MGVCSWKEIAELPGSKPLDALEVIARMDQERAKEDLKAMPSAAALAPVSNVCNCLRGCCEGLMRFADSKGVAAEGEELVSKLCQAVTKALVGKVVDIYTRVSSTDDLPCLCMIREEVEHRLSGVRVADEEGALGAVRGGLGELWAFAALCSMGMSRGWDGRGVGGKPSASGAVMSGLLMGGGRVVMQIDVQFDGLGEGLRESLCEVDMGGLVGEVRLPDGAFKGARKLVQVVWPVGVTSIGEPCFEESGLEVLDLGQLHIRRIGKRCFFSCRRLSRV